MPGVSDYPAPVVRNAGAELELIMMRWEIPPSPSSAVAPETKARLQLAVRRVHPRGGLRSNPTASVSALGPLY
jgi:hypothetical protein